MLGTPNGLVQLTIWNSLTDPEKDFSKALNEEPVNTKLLLYSNIERRVLLAEHDEDLKETLDQITTLLASLMAKDKIIRIDTYKNIDGAVCGIRVSEQIQKLKLPPGMKKGGINEGV